MLLEARISSNSRVRPNRSSQRTSRRTLIGSCLKVSRKVDSSFAQAQIGVKRSVITDRSFRE
ncbi:Uncharacterised protein [Vibrio cholerae]|nr:Uncharacterised protein [Vibrio cholerae]